MTKFTALFLSSMACLCFLLVVSCEDTIDMELEGSITGRAVNSNNEALANVSITTEPATQAILTDSSGHFSIPRVSVGEYTVNARKEGFRNETLRIRVRGEEASSVNIIMRADRGAGSLRAPQAPFPADGSTGQATELTLAWSPAADTQDEDLVYDVFLYDSEGLSGEPIATGISDTSISIPALAHNTAYFWQVSAYTNEDNRQLSSLWSFRTLQLPENLIFFSRNENGNFNIFSQPLNSEEDDEALAVIRQGGHQQYPSLSPDRSRLAYSANQNGEWHIYKADNQGNNRRRITELPISGHHNNGRGFCWSPDGGHFLYSHYDRLYTIRENGSELQLLATAPEGRHWREVDWTAQDGGRIMAVAIGTNINDAEIYIMDEDGENMEMIVENEPGQLGSPKFSIDARRIVFTRDISGFEPENGGNRQLDSRIFLMELETGTLSDLSGSRSGSTNTQKPDGTNDLMPDFSPNGATVVFVNVSNDGLTPPSVHAFSIDGSNRRLLLEDATTPNWR